MITLKCDEPIRIRNKYTGDWLFVNCRKCQSCRINQVNTKTVHLSEEVVKYPFKMMVTLTYDNDHLPYVCIDDNRVFRGMPDVSFPEIIGRVDLDRNIKFKSIVPTGFKDGCYTSVLFYPDIQKFFKRLRFNYGKRTKQRFPYFYHAIGEYGTSSRRCHFHILFYGREEFTESFRDAVIESWTLHNWSKLELEEVFKYASDGVSSYLTSYVNSMSCCDEFLCQKGIKPKTLRSKTLSFGIDKELLQTFQESIKRGFYHRDFERISTSFGSWDCRKLGDISLRLIPSKVVSSYFALPTSIYRSSFGSLYECYSNCIRGYFEGKRKGIDIESFFYRVYLSFDKYCKLRGLGMNESSLMDFALDSKLVNNYYKSCILRLSMEAFDGDSKGYKDSCYNTYSEDLDKRNYWLLCNGLNKVDDVNSPDSYMELQTYKLKYKYKLLPKHLHGLLNGNNL